MDVPIAEVAEAPVPVRTGLTIPRVLTREGVHPYDAVEWERSDVVIRNWRDDTISFQQRGVEFPASWSAAARQIVTSKYFRGAPRSLEREWSLKQLLDRVVDTYTQAGIDNHYFRTDADSEVFNHEMKAMLLAQLFAFNSPVWFNVGTSSPQQVSACFLLAVEDSMESILNWYGEEGMIFKGGSGAGVNLSRIRGSGEILQSSGGRASGPVSFMRGADASAGTIKSGGATRRAAKLVCLDVDHPDIRTFINAKAREEKKIRVLADAGYDMDLGGADAYSVQYQNANNSVRVSDAFMQAVEADEEWDLTARVTGEPVAQVRARDLFRLMAQAAWDCADPGIQYDDTINGWHTTPESGRITTSNPCAEFMHVDNSSCNLASLNLLKFLRADGSFDSELFIKVTELLFTAMDISICFADFPTEKITEVTHSMRHLGIGYSNLGAMLMASGCAYDSGEGRSLAAAVTSLMQAVVYRRSALLGSLLGPYPEWDRNARAHRRIAGRHARAHEDLAVSLSMSRTAASVIDAADPIWAAAALSESRYRNAHLSLLAPAGTISFMMDCDTTGVEPDFALVKRKKTADGSTMEIVNRTVARGLRALGYESELIEAIVKFVAENGHVEGAPGLSSHHYTVFDCAVGDRSITSMGHVRMMAAVQPFLSGAISKTVNLPETATVEQIEEVYLQGWRSGLKALAVYRDNCKSSQPLSTKPKVAVEAAGPHITAPVRHRLPRRRDSVTTSFEVGGAQGYMTTSRYPDDGIAEMFLKLGKLGSTMSGMLDAFSVAVSIALQHGVPLETYVAKFCGMQFEPRGMTDDPDIRIATSIVDYLFRRIALDYLPEDRRRALGVLTTAERAAEESGVVPEAAPVPDRSASALFTVLGALPEAPLCLTCGVAMIRAGVCYACESCGSTSGCS